MSLLVLSHESALAFWRDGAPCGDAPARPLDAAACAQVARASGVGVSAAQLDEAAAHESLSSLSHPLDILTCERGSRRSTALARYRCVQTAFPAGSFVHICTHAGIDVYVCSPELVYAQMARTLDDWELIELGFELCGRCRDGNPVTTPALLQAYAQQAAGMTGGKRARRMAAHVLADARSAHEAHLAMLAHLPRSLGGMGTAAPQLSARIDAPAVVARQLGSRNATPALYWPDAHLALEYDRHPQRSDTHADYLRRMSNAYRMLGIELVVVSPEQLADADSARGAFDIVNRACGVRLKPANDAQRERQAALIVWIAQAEGHGSATSHA